MLRSARRVALVFVALVLGVSALALAAPPGAEAAPNNFVTMPDGVQIAINVRMPDNYVPGQRYPTLFEMSGYDGGSAQGGTLLTDFGLDGLDLPVLPAGDSRQISSHFNGEYVTIHASVRGTGCSSGEFDLFSSKSAEDGKFIIDNWIPDQPWSNGDVAYIGHSYGGITGFMIVESQPSHLRVASLSGLIDDMYRGITYPGGVSNYGFPLAWTGVLRPAYDVLGGTAPGLVREESNEYITDRRLRCANNQLAKRRALLDDPLVQGLSDTDSEWFRTRSLITRVADVKVPIHITGAYQDEQTGPRGPTHLWEQVRGVPKRLLLSNGDHNTQNPGLTGPEIWGDRKAYIDHFMGVLPHPEFGSVGQDRKSVRILLETHRDANGELVSNGHIEATNFPLPNTAWTNYYLHAGGQLTKTKPGLLEAPSDTYLSGSRRESWSYQAGPSFGPPFTTADGPDELLYATAPATSPMVIAGPITATLNVSTTGIDTELFVQLIDEDTADGSRTYLQRGMLKASHRAIDPTKSDYAGSVLYRPWRPHTNPELLMPLTAYEYLVEVFPVGHVIRPGHRLLMKISAPPLVDSFYAYVPKTLPGLNSVFHTSVQASRLTLPVVPVPGNLGAALACGSQEAVRCISNPNGT
jgi:putative CocE/NonD family hydrolase